MLETVVVGALLLAAIAVSAVAWSYRRFAGVRARLVEYLGQAAPEMTVRALTKVGFVAVALGSEVDVDLATLARRRPRGMSEREWFDQVLDGIRARVPVPQAPPYPLVMDRLMPLLKPAAYVRIFEHYPPALRLAWRALASEVAITYVIAGTHQRTLVTARALEAWQIEVETLHAQAVANLRAQTAHMLEEIGGPRARYEHLDGSEATRILVADLIVPHDVTDPVIAIPEETMLLIAPEQDRAALAAEAASHHASSTRPVSPLVFRLSPDGPVPLEEPSSPRPDRQTG